MSLKEGGRLNNVLLFKGLCIFIVSLVNFISKEPEEYSVARAKITQTVKANSGYVNAVEKEFAGRKVPQTYQNCAMIVGLM